MACQRWSIMWPRYTRKASSLVLGERNNRIWRTEVRRDLCQFPVDSFMFSTALQMHFADWLRWRSNTRQLTSSANHQMAVWHGQTAIWWISLWLGEVIPVPLCPIADEYLHSPNTLYYKKLLVVEEYWVKYSLYAMNITCSNVAKKSKFFVICNLYWSNIAGIHTCVEIAHFPMRCIITTWEVWGHRPSAFQVLVMHVQSTCFCFYPMTCKKH